MNPASAPSISVPAGRRSSLASAITSSFDNVGLALSTLRANPLRSLLTVLGIVIGAATVVAMMALTEGLKHQVGTSLSVLGAGSFQVQRWPALGGPSTDWMKYRRRKKLTAEQGLALRELCPSVARVALVQFSSAKEAVATRERTTKPTVEIIGSTPEYEQVNGLTVGQGRFFSQADLELDRNVAVIGADVADVLFPGQGPLGQKLRLRSSTFTVIGVVDRMGSILGLESRDSFVAVPLASFARVFGREHDMAIAVQAADPKEMAKAQDEVVAVLRRLRGVQQGQEDDFDIFSNESLTGTFENLSSVIAAATFGLCALALLVGGIGIMNIMLVSVVERTREIGVRMALGARRRRLLTQFVLEAVTLSLLGGLLGVLAGAGIAVFAREAYRVPAIVPGWAVALALASACSSGLVFGIYPAMRASRLDPVEAMRAE
jgi:putative ABC transport system permease protein